MSEFSQELAQLRERSQYKPQMVHEIERLLAASGDTVSELFDTLDNVGNVSSRVRDDMLLNQLRDKYECITLLVGSELDTVTAGERGLGRHSTSVPRFGGRFRDRLTSGAVAEFGPVMEELCIQGFAAGVIYDALLPDGPATLRHHSVDELLPRWINHFAVALSNSSNSFLAVANATAESSIESFERRAERHGLVKGLRKKKEAAVVGATAQLLVGAGADLYFFTSSRTDNEYS